MPISSQDLDVLTHFLSFPLNSATKLLEQFRSLPGSVAPEAPPSELQQFVYVPGSRKDRVLLLAHADTVWDDNYIAFPDSTIWQRLVSKKKSNGQLILCGENPEFGIGADDRAGCAILWQLRDSGHSLLLLNGEECGQQGACYLREAYPELFAEINQHQFALQFDRRNAIDYKVYHLPVSQAFHAYIQKNTGYLEPDRNACTDICTICQNICGANLSVGYYNEHRATEYLNVEEWQHTLEITRKMLAKECPHFPMRK